MNRKVGKCSRDTQRNTVLSPEIEQFPAWNTGISLSLTCQWVRICAVRSPGGLLRSQEWVGCGLLVGPSGALTASPPGVGESRGTRGQHGPTPLRHIGLCTSLGLTKVHTEPKQAGLALGAQLG